MKRYLTPSLLILLLVAPLYARVNIPVNCRVPNEPPGYCSWSSLATIGKAMRIKKLANILKSRKSERVDQKHLGGIDDVHAELRRLGIKHHYQRPGHFSLRLIKRAIKKNLACVVAIQDERGAHAIIVTDWHPKWFEYVDTNNTGSDYVGSNEYFMKYWQGYTIVIEKQ